MEIDLEAIERGDIVRLPVKHKEPPSDERMLVDVPYSTCQHYRGPYEIDMKAGKCRCLQCQAEVSPMFVLEHLMKEESRWMRARCDYQDEMRRLAERSRTKCQHCGQVTTISRR